MDIARLTRRQARRVMQDVENAMLNNRLMTAMALVGITDDIFQTASPEDLRDAFVVRWRAIADRAGVAITWGER